MLLVLVLLASLSVCNGENVWYKAECSEETEPAVTLEPSKDGVKGRYVVRCCASASPLPTGWTVELRTLNLPPEQCNIQLDKQLDLVYKPHSYIDEKLNLSISCPRICLSQTLDLIFESCYWLTNQLTRKPLDNNKTNGVAEWVGDLFKYVQNGIPRFTKKNTTPFVECTDWDEKVVCKWLEGIIPYTEYQVLLYPGLRTDEDLQNNEMTVTENCTRLGGAHGTVKCELVVAPGSYTLLMVHHAPWTRGLTDLVTHKAYFNYTTQRVTFSASKSSSASLLWIVGVCGVLAVSLVTGLMVYQRRVDAKNKLKKFQQWRACKEEGESKEDVPLESPSESVAVLLLYARDCPAAQRVATALLTLLREHYTGQVFDLYSAEITARAGESPGAFVRECMTSPSIAVVLLQTPALAALHTVRFADMETLKLEAPLLPTQVMYRRPKFGDALLQYALQLMRETRPDRPYRKYKLATLSALDVDAFPSIVPYTRYALPADALALARSLEGAAPPAPHAPPLEPLAALSAACDQLVSYVTDNPNYLAEQIVFL